MAETTIGTSASFWDWCKGPGGIIASIITSTATITAAVVLTYSSFNSQLADAKKELANYASSVNKLMERQDNRDDSVNTIVDAVSDWLRLEGLSLTRAQRWREAERLISKVEQKRIAKFNDSLSAGGGTGLPSK